MIKTLLIMWLEIYKVEGYPKSMDKSNNDKQMNGVQYYGIDALPTSYMYP